MHSSDKCEQLICCKNASDIGLSDTFRWFATLVQSLARSCRKREEIVAEGLEHTVNTARRDVRAYAYIRPIVLNGLLVVSDVLYSDAIKQKRPQDFG